MVQNNYHKIILFNIILKMTRKTSCSKNCKLDGVFFFIYKYFHLIFKIYFKRCVTFARATAKACSAENGYWKSSVYAFPSILPNCMTFNLKII